MLNNQVDWVSGTFRPCKVRSNASQQFVLTQNTFLDISPTFTSSVRDKVPGRYYDFLQRHLNASNQDHLVYQVKGPTETFLWQLEGSAIITYGNGEKVFPASKII